MSLSDDLTIPSEKTTPRQHVFGLHVWNLHRSQARRSRDYARKGSTIALRSAIWIMLGTGEPIIHILVLEAFSVEDAWRTVH